MTSSARARNRISSSSQWQRVVSLTALKLLATGSCCVLATDGRDVDQRDDRAQTGSMGAEDRFGSVAMALGISLAASRCCRRTMVSSAAAATASGPSAGSAKVILPVDTVSTFRQGVALLQG